MDYRGWRSAALDATWPAAEGAAGLEAALDRICSEASAAIDDGVALLVLSDRAAGAAPRRRPACREQGLPPGVRGLLYEQAFAHALHIFARQVGARRVKSDRKPEALVAYEWRLRDKRQFEVCMCARARTVHMRRPAD